MGYTIEFIEGASQDFQKLDGSQKIVVRKSLTKLEKYGMQAGEAFRGGLAGCRKLKHK